MVDAQKARVCLQFYENTDRKSKFGWKGGTQEAVRLLGGRCVRSSSNERQTPVEQKKNAARNGRHFAACRKTSTRFSKMQAFFRGDAGRCAHSLSLAHLRPGECVFRRTRRRKTRFDPLPPSADGGTLRGSCSINRRNILY